MEKVILILCHLGAKQEERCVVEPQYVHPDQLIAFRTRDVQEWTFQGVLKGGELVNIQAM